MIVRIEEAREVCVDLRIRVHLDAVRDFGEGCGSDRGMPRSAGSRAVRGGPLPPAAKFGDGLDLRVPDSAERLGLVHLVNDSNGENQTRAEGKTKAEAWRNAVGQAAAVGMLNDRIQSVARRSRRQA